MQQAYAQQEAAKGRLSASITPAQAASIYNYGPANKNKTKKAQQGKQNRKSRKATKKNRKTRRAQKGGDACPKGGNHDWKRDNPKNMAGWCTCKKCGAKQAGVC